MTLQEAKDEVARKPCYGYESWQDMKSALGERVFRWVVEDRMCEVAELYLQSNLTHVSENSGGGEFKPCGEGDNICNCKSSYECGYSKWHNDATKEACAEIAKNYRPNH